MKDLDDTAHYFLSLAKGMAALQGIEGVCNPAVIDEVQRLNSALLEFSAALFELQASLMTEETERVIVRPKLRLVRT